MKSIPRPHAALFMVPALMACSLLANAQDQPRERSQSSPFGVAYRNTYGKFPAKATLGDRMTADFFHRQTQALAERSLSSVTSHEDWLQQKDQLRQQLLEMLSLDPMPARTELHATITGTIDRPDFIVEKLHFQSRPGLYVTANVYVPKGMVEPAPAILYVCGHGKVEIDGISYGNKATYQHHGAWFARNGYVCIILDSVQLGEIEASITAPIAKGCGGGIRGDIRRLALRPGTVFEHSTICNRDRMSMVNESV